MILDYSPASYLTLCLSYRVRMILFGLLRLLAPFKKNSAGGLSPGEAICFVVKKFYQLRARERLKLANSRS